MNTTNMHINSNGKLDNTMNVTSNFNDMDKMGRTNTDVSHMDDKTMEEIARRAQKNAAH